MKKLMLALDDLRVDTFDLQAAAPAHGTVRGHGDSEAETQCVDVCWSRGGTCGADLGFAGRQRPALDAYSLPNCRTQFCCV